MKQAYRMISVSLILTFFVSISPGFAADKKQYPTSPPKKIVKKWRIGYIEGGKYKDYQKVFIATVQSLSELGWIEKITIPEQEDKTDNRKIWAWLSANAKSRYLEFVADAYYSGDFKEDLRERNKKNLLGRLNETKDIDLVMAFGTWAGQDMATDKHSVPTVVCSVSDPISAKIVKSAEDSGYDHIHARVDPTRFERQVKAFHDVIGFKKLGIIYENTETGKSLIAFRDLEKIAGERKFDIVSCHTGEQASKEEVHSQMIKCVNELAPKIDAFYFPVAARMTPEFSAKILESMNTHKIPTFSQAGVEEVRRGALLSIFPDFKGVGKFYAETIAKVINDAKPRELNQVYEAPVKIAFNAATAMMIGLKPEVYNMLSQTAEEVYKEIETAK